jgi:hypothetical protein
MRASQDYILNEKSAIFPRRRIHQVCTPSLMQCGDHNLFLSPKFFRKISYITSLSELAFQVPLTQIDVLPTVYQYVVAFNFIYIY